MNPKRIWANLGVANIDKTRDFYLALGFQLNGTPTKDLVSFLFGDDAFVIHFFEKEKLKQSMEGEISNLNQGNEIMFTMAAESKKEFDTWIAEIKKAGGSVFFDSNTDRKEFYDKNGYYVCVFADPDGHKFNLFYNDN
ncbi:VOC family protein [Zhouia spongiae]|uniref:VOC family protein n=1 Tax=Zhouia spongiae TaxID=2202721 RepID=A0ABY3YNZ0_9FLAO|nr:VOC family protein [Zhouia spongiae]UNY99340.1 VOC family protein [Zhouia spongiae]